MNPLTNERHISFAINTENDSNESHHTAIVMNDDDGDGNPTTGFPRIRKPKNDLFLIYLSPIATNITGKSRLIRRNSAKLRKPSFRMKDGGKSKERIKSLNRNFISMIRFSSFIISNTSS